MSKFNFSIPNQYSLRTVVFILLTLFSIPFFFGVSSNMALAKGDGVVLANNKSTTEDKKEDSEEGDNLNNVNVSMNTDGSLSINGIENGNATSTWNNIFNKYKVFIIGISGIATLTFVLLFIKNFVSVGANSNNPTGRRESITGCLWTGLAAAGCGAVTIVVGLFWNALK